MYFQKQTLDVLCQLFGSTVCFVRTACFNRAAPRNISAKLLRQRLKERYKWSRIYETNWLYQVELDLLLEFSLLITASCISTGRMLKVMGLNPSECTDLYNVHQECTVSVFYKSICQSQVRTKTEMLKSTVAVFEKPVENVISGI